MTKNFDELEFTDNFMFSRVMYENPDLCCGILGLLFQKPVSLLPDQIEIEKPIKKRISAKGIRMDVYVKDDEETVYDIEMQVRTKDNLSKRSRYYHSMIDLDLLGPGKLFSTLKPSYVIFILKHRPGENYTKPVYTFRYQCQEHSSVYLEDGSWTIFINADPDLNDPDYLALSPEMKAFLTYVKTGQVTDEADSLVDRIADAVQKGRLNEDWRSDYMTVEDYGNEKYQEGEEKGREEGRKEERKNTERERARADAAEKKLAEANKELAEALAMIEKLKAVK